MNAYLMAHSLKGQNVKQVPQKPQQQVYNTVQKQIQPVQPVVEEVNQQKQVIQNKPIKKFLANRVNGKFISTNPNQVKKQKKELPWLSSYKITQIDKPVIIQNNNTNKRFQISFQYQDEESGKLHKKTVKFGQKNQEEFIDHHNYQLREKTLNNLRKYHNPLKGNFWRNQLLNTTDNLQENYLNLLKTIF